MANSKTRIIILTFLVTLSWQVSSVLGGCAGEKISAAKIVGKKFYDTESGQYIPIKGIDYYPRPNAGKNNRNSVDFFTEEYRHIWERDIVQFKALGVNAVRLYSVDPSKNHDAFMCALKSEGIYAIVGLASSCGGCAITGFPIPDCYPASLKNRGQLIINVFSKYDNVIGFSAGNEINHVAPDGQPEVNAPCQKQFIRDMRAHIQRCSSTMRHIPVGVVVADNARSLNALYYGCRSDPNDELENAEFYGINVYLHCDANSKTIDNLAGYKALQTDFKSYNLSIPVLLTEYGCLNPSFATVDGYEAQRDFLQVKALHSPLYREDFAGGFAFEYSTEKVFAQDESPWPFKNFGSGNYGLGYFEPEECDDINTPCTYKRFPQFQSLANAHSSVDTSDVPPVNVFSLPVDNQQVANKCPARFDGIELSSIEFPSANLIDLSCPPQKEEFVCCQNDVQYCEDYCDGTYPFGCALSVPGKAKYGCRPGGGCHYTDNKDDKYPISGFCSYQLGDISLSKPTAAPFPTEMPIAVPEPSAAPVSTSVQPTPETTSCIDLPGWVDSVGDGCDRYFFFDECGSYGDQYKNNGLTAIDACCACGGGQSSTTSSPSPESSTDAPAFKPTKSPTSTPTEELSANPTTKPVIDTTIPTDSPTISPTFEPTTTQTAKPSAKPTTTTAEPTLQPSESTSSPTTSPPTSKPTSSQPTLLASPSPTSSFSSSPTLRASQSSAAPTSSSSLTTNTPTTKLKSSLPTTAPTDEFPPSSPPFPTDTPTETPSKSVVAVSDMLDGLSITLYGIKSSSPSSRKERSRKLQNSNSNDNEILDGDAINIFENATSLYTSEFYENNPNLGVNDVISVVTVTDQKSTESNDGVIVTYKQDMTYSITDDDSNDGFTPADVASAPFATEKRISSYVNFLQQEGTKSGNYVFNDVTSASSRDSNGINPIIDVQEENDGGGFWTTGVIIGIAVGGGVALLLLIGGGIWFSNNRCRRNSRKYESATVKSNDIPVSTLRIEGLGHQDDISTLEDASNQKAGGDGNESSASDDYDYCRAYGNGANSSAVSLTDGTYGESSANDISGVGHGFGAVGGGGVLESVSEEGEYDYHHYNQTKTREESIDVFVPAGKLGVIIDTPSDIDGPPVVHTVKDSSVVADKFNVGDKLYAIDDIDVRSMTAIEVSKLLSSRSANSSRKISIVRTIQ